MKATVFRQTQFADFELARAPDGGAGEAADRRFAREALSRDHQEILRPRSGSLRGRRLHRARVERDSALLQQLLRVSVRDVVHGRHRAVGRRPGSRRGRCGRDEAIPPVPVLRWLEVPDRPAERRRRRHDRRRAARADDAQDESGDGRNRRSPRRLSTLHGPPGG